jgi:hypothetical protein
MSGTEASWPERGIEALNHLVELGFTDDQFRRLHHFQEDALCINPDRDWSGWQGHEKRSEPPQFIKCRCPSPARLTQGQGQELSSLLQQEPAANQSVDSGSHGDVAKVLRVPADREHQFQLIVNTRSSRW